MLHKRFTIIGMVLIFLAVFLGCKKEVVKDKAYYYQMGNKYFNEQQFENAAESFKSVVEDFPGTVYRAKSLFFLGFIYANNLKDQPKALKLAEKYYKQLIKEFPNDELVQSARVELDNLGKDPEDIIFPTKNEDKK